MYHKYAYNGPIMVYGEYRGTFQAETFAITGSKARSNIAYQAKQKMKIAANAKVELPGELKFIY